MNLREIKEGDEFILSEVFGEIKYCGKGTFIAGGAGITPFISIFRQLRKDNLIEGNSLIFSNKTSKDIILEEDLKAFFGNKAIFTLTREKNLNYINNKTNRNKAVRPLRRKPKRRDVSPEPGVFRPPVTAAKTHSSITSMAATQPPTHWRKASSSGLGTSSMSILCRWCAGTASSPCCSPAAKPSRPRAPSRTDHAHLDPLRG